VNKAEILIWRDRLLQTAQQASQKVGGPPLRDDGKLYHLEYEGENLWFQRLSAEIWPHLAEGAAHLACPGLRYEVAYFQKQPQWQIALLCGSHDPELQQLMQPLFHRFLEDGRYAKRYRPLGPLWKSVDRETIGVQRTLAPDKLPKAMSMLIDETFKPVHHTLLKDDPHWGQRFQKSGQERDLLAELQAHFGQ